MSRAKKGGFQAFVAAKKGKDDEKAKGKRGNVKKAAKAKLFEKDGSKSDTLGS